MNEFKKCCDGHMAHTITSNNMLLCPDTDRVVAVFYHDYDIDAILNEEVMTDGHQSPVKIIQMLATPNDAYYQGAIMGLGDDGVIYLAVDGGWEVHISLEFKENKQ